MITNARGCGGIGRHARFRFWWATVQVQILSPASLKPLIFKGFFSVFAALFQQSQACEYRQGEYS